MIEHNHSAGSFSCPVPGCGASQPHEADLKARLEQAEAIVAVLAAAAQQLLDSLPEGEIDVARECWGNTNAHIVLASRRLLAVALVDLPAAVLARVEREKRLVAELALGLV